MYCNNCNRKINVESTVCPLCGNRIMENVEWVKTGIILRIGALMMSIFSIMCITGGWAKENISSDWGGESVEYTIFNLSDFFEESGRYINDSTIKEYEFLFGLASLLAVISMFAHIFSALCALINSESSTSTRKTAGVLTFIMIIVSRIAVGKLEGDIKIIESTWTWIILAIIVLIDMSAIAPKVGIKKIDYSKCTAPIDKPNLPNEALLQRGGWKCSSCNKINASYVNTCSCGNVNR